MKTWMFVLGMWLAAIFGFFVLLLYANSLQALTITGNNESCMNIAISSGYVANNRDQGDTWVNAEPQLKKALATVKGDADSYVKDDDDVKLVLALFKEIFERDDSVEDTIHSVYRSCMSVKITPINRRML